MSETPRTWSLSNVPTPRLSVGWALFAVLLVAVGACIGFVGASVLSDWDAWKAAVVDVVEPLL